MLFFFDFEMISNNQILLVFYHYNNVLNVQDNVGETVDDTYQDLSVYAIIAQLVKNGKWGK